MTGTEGGFLESGELLFPRCMANMNSPPYSTATMVSRRIPAVRVMSVVSSITPPRRVPVIRSGLEANLAAIPDRPSRHGSQRRASRLPSHCSLMGWSLRKSPVGSLRSVAIISRGFKDDGPRGPEPRTAGPVPHSRLPCAVRGALLASRWSNGPSRSPVSSTSPDPGPGRSSTPCPRRR